MPTETLTREIFGNIGTLPQAIFYALAILAGLIIALGEVVDDAIIDSLIDLDSAIKTETLGAAAFASRAEVIGADRSIIVPDAGNHSLDTMEIPELIDSIKQKPRLDSERIRGD